MLSSHASTPKSVLPTSNPDMRGTQTNPNLHGAQGSPSGQPSIRQLPSTHTDNATINIKLPTPPAVAQPNSSTDVDAISNPPNHSRHSRHHSSPSLLRQVVVSQAASDKSYPQQPCLRVVDMPLTGDKRPGRSPDASPRGILSGWLPGSGSSAGTEAASPTVNRPGKATNNSPFDSTPTKLRKRFTVANDSASLSAYSSVSSSPFAFFASQMSAFTKSPRSPTSPVQEDELLGLDITAALFPSSSPNDRDAFSPAAFKNLEANAMGLLNKFQNAYRQQNAELREFRREKEAQNDELEEADTRTMHLKLQLENMSKEAAVHQCRMQELTDQLAAERRLRLEERIAREKGLPTDGSTMSEDLSVEEDQRRRNWRKSRGSDTDEESVEGASVFSRSRSPTIAASVFEGSVAEMGSPQPPARGPAVVPLRPPRSVPQISAFQKILKGISGDGTKEDDVSRGAPAVCRNCQGQDSQTAWNTVSLLRDENKELKHRVAALESCVDGALDAINGVGMG